jgi:hypothetical protein
MKHDNNQEQMNRVKSITDKLSMSLFGTTLRIIVEFDKIFGGRIYIQIAYDAPCTKTGSLEEWKGRKWPLSEFMTDDEIVKTAYVAFKMCVEHEIMEGFKYDGKIVFNPHVNFMELLAVSDKEVRRS